MQGFTNARQSCRKAGIKILQKLKTVIMQLTTKDSLLHLLNMKGNPKKLEKLSSLQLRLLRTLDPSVHLQSSKGLKASVEPQKGIFVRL